MQTLLIWIQSLLDKLTSILHNEPRRNDLQKLDSAILVWNYDREMANMSMTHAWNVQNSLDYLANLMHRNVLSLLDH